MYLDNFKNQIIPLCKKNKVKSLYVFGSVLTDSFRNNSDIDFIVEIDTDDPIDYAEKYFNLKFDLENLFNRQIDLLENKALKNPFLKDSIDHTKSLVYAA